MVTTNDIEGFFGPYRFLSNFWGVPHGVMLDGHSYPTVEHAYQAAKTLNPNERTLIRQLSEARDAKNFSRQGKLTLRSDWDRIKLMIMQQLLREKFKPGTDLARQLMATMPRGLIESNPWGDTFWGVMSKGPRKGVGTNHLGRLLMERRLVLCNS